jgi:hypothetical protein
MNKRIYKIDPNVVWKEADGTIYILQPEREEIHALNETGVFIWKLISKGYSLTEVKAELLSHYNVTADVGSKDIQEFIDRYVREKFLALEHRKPKNK